MSERSTRRNTVLETTGNKRSIRQARSDDASSKKSVSLIPKPLAVFGGIFGIKNSLTECSINGLKLKAAKIHAKIDEDNKIYQYNNSISGGRDPVASAYSAIMHQTKMQSLEQQQKKIMRRCEKAQHRLERNQKVIQQLVGTPIRGLNQMSQTMTRKAAYSQMVGNQSGVNRADLAIASGLMSDDTEFC